MQTRAWDKVANDIDFNLEIDVTGFTQRVPRDASILDYGCGYGRISALLHSAGYNKVIGVDSSSGMIQRGITEYPHLTLEQTQGPGLKYSDDSFDAVIVCAILTCLPEAQHKNDALAEIERVLKPGGILHVVEFCSDSSSIFESGIGIVMHHQNPEEFRKLLGNFSELSFVVTTCQTMGGSDAQAISYFGHKIM